MNIIFDLDGTLTDFNAFIEKNAIPFFEKKYNMVVADPNALELEDIFDIKNYLYRQGLSEKEVKKKKDEMLDRFWIGTNFLKFTLFNRLRKNASQCIRKLIKQGHSVRIYTSRAKTCQKDMIGFIARSFTYIQCLFNGIPVKKCKILFYRDDEQKIKAIKKKRPDVVFDDKVEILRHLNQMGIILICVSGRHNKNIVPEDKIRTIEKFDYNEIDRILEHAIGEKRYRYILKISRSEIVWKKVMAIAPLVKRIFKPIVLNRKNLIKDPVEGVIYTSNHRSTLDPMVITVIVGEHIHYAALKRFFEGKDSIFNNNKNIFLCKFTSWLFEQLAFFPIERKEDNSSANNIESIREMNYCLNNRFKLGIFPEGTIRREEGRDFGNFDSSFIVLAKKNDAWIQPVTILWKNSIRSKKSIPIVNFGKPFKVGNMSVAEAMEFYLMQQERCLSENKNVNI